MESVALCTLFGAVISFLVSGLKDTLPFFKNRPKTSALVVCVAVAVVSQFLDNAAGFSLVFFIQCVITQFTAAVATYEAGTRQVQKMIKDGDGRDA